MLKIGSIGKLRGKRLTFREWVVNLPDGYRGGRYFILALLNPSKFPSGAVVFSLGEEGSVKLTLKEETYRSVLKSFKFRKGQDRAGIRLYFVLDGDGNYYIDGEEDERGGYIVQNWGWKFTSNIEEEVEL